MSGDWLLEGATKHEQSITSDWQPTQLQLIDGVYVKEMRNVPSGYGFLTEIFRTEWNLGIGTVDQVFQATLFPGRISAWHAHEVTVDRLFVNQGMVKVVLYDARTDSPTYRLINEFRLGVHRPALVVVPPKVWHGIQNVWNEVSSVINLVDQAYRYEDPDHWRLPWDTDKIPYSFTA